MLLQYNKATESWRDNAMDNAPIEVSLAAQSEMVKERADQQTVVLFKK